MFRKYSLSYSVFLFLEDVLYYEVNVASENTSANQKENSSSFNDQTIPLRAYSASTPLLTSAAVLADPNFLSKDDALIASASLSNVTTLTTKKIHVYV